MLFIADLASDFKINRFYKVIKVYCLFFKELMVRG